jgi:hypothetical protein
MSYTYVIERDAAQMVLRLGPRERRFLQASFERIADTPSAPADLEEVGVGGRQVLTRFFGPYSVTFWLDHAVKEVRIAVVYRD